MKAGKRKGLSLNQILAIIIIVLLVAIAGMMAFLIARTQGGEAGQPVIPTKPAVNQPQVQEDPAQRPTVGISDVNNPFADGVIETPYGTLYFPEELSGNLYVQEQEGDGYRLSFLARLPGLEEVRLFELCIAQLLEEPWGDLITADGTAMEWGFVFHEIKPDKKWNAAEQDMIFGMQEAVNELAEQMEALNHEMPEVTLPEFTIPEAETTLIIHTPSGEIEYTGSWGEYLNVTYPEGEVYRIVFSAKLEGREEILLFSFTYGGSEDTAVGYAKDAEGNMVPLNLMVYEFGLDESWTEAEQNLIFGLQEELNYFMEVLPEA